MDAASSPAAAAFHSERGGDAVRMDVLRALLQLGEARQGIARLFVQRVVHLKQDGFVALRNQRIRRVVGHAVRVCILSSSWTRWRSFPRPGQRFWTLQDAEVR